MDKFQVTILGCGSAKPSLRHHPSAQLISYHDKLFLIDCGEGTQMQLMKARCKLNRMQHIFISHLHGDHCYGLPGLLSTMGLTGLCGEVTIHLPEEGVRLFKPLLEYSTHGLTVDFKPYPRESHVIYEDNTLTVRTIPLKHRLPCVGFVFKEKPKLRHINRAMVDFHQVPVRTLPSIRSGADFTKPDGTVIPNKMLTTPPDPVRMYAYVSDTLPLTAVADEVRGADLLYHEATFLSDMHDRAKETFHSTARDAGRIARLAEAKRLIVGHFSSRYLNEQPILDEAKAEFPDTILAREMLSIDI